MAYEDGQWLAEKPPHICFTPYLRAVCSQIVGREKDPLRIAKEDIRSYNDFGGLSVCAGLLQH